MQYYRAIPELEKECLLICFKKQIVEDDILYSKIIQNKNSDYLANKYHWFLEWIEVTDEYLEDICKYKNLKIRELNHFELYRILKGKYVNKINEQWEEVKRNLLNSCRTFIPYRWNDLYELTKNADKKSFYQEIVAQKTYPNDLILDDNSKDLSLGRISLLLEFKVFDE